MDNHNSTLVWQGTQLLNNQLVLISPTTVGGTLYGIAFTLFCFYVHSLVLRLQARDRIRQAKFMLAYSFIIMVCGLYFLVANAWITQNAYIEHGNFPGGASSYIESTLRTPVIIAGLGCELVVDTLTSAIQIWRVWVVWSATSYAKLVIVLPSLCFLTFTALNLKTVVLESTLPIAELTQLDERTVLAQNAIQGATTLLCTTSISLLLIFRCWRQRKLTDEASPGSIQVVTTVYMKIVTMLIESYALESIWVFIVALLLSHPVETFFVKTRLYIEIIAYLLVQYRVSSGKTSESSQEGRTNISSLHWKHYRNVTIRSSETSEAENDFHVVSVKPEVDLLSVASMA